MEEMKDELLDEKETKLREEGWGKGRKQQRNKGGENSHKGKDET